LIILYILMSIKVNNTFYEFNCPYCNIHIMVMKNEVNCKIFRCGVFKQTGQPIHPHLSEVECKRMVKENLIYGCGNPFIFNGSHVEKCGYI
jgi:hypothetical protein